MLILLFRVPICIGVAILLIVINKYVLLLHLAIPPCAVMSEVVGSAACGITFSGSHDDAHVAVTCQNRT
jgi:hypothetical protein